ncbi:hypothetical protein BJ742DRAFT_841031 [Cladochytrium replicatum]|nr:hypothetical protein BJ742DRAFT_841031 [Cladochytrium replicatum]
MSTVIPASSPSSSLLGSNSANGQILRRSSNIMLTSYIPTTALIGVSILATAFLPRTVALVLGGLAFTPSVYSLFTRLTGTNPRHNAVTKTIRRGRFAATIKGDFVVFLIGIRPNAALPLSSNFAKAGEAFTAILKELNDNPELGCLGIEQYVGDSEGGSLIMSVQYWRSAEHLARYAASRSSEHHSPWLWLMKLGRESPELGFWHETFIVREGDYESISVNCPPFHLCNARTAEVVPAQRNMATMKGRLGKGTGDAQTEWPEGFDREANY